jgi:quercetin dioxygenase-like cupin family protein
MIIKHIADVPLQVVTTEGARGVKVRIIYGPKDVAPNFAMRLFEVEPDGHTPFHYHPFEHQIIVMEGVFSLVSDDGSVELRPGDAVMILPDSKHQMRNRSDGVSKFICMIPIEFQK